MQLMGQQQQQQLLPQLQQHWQQPPAATEGSQVQLLLPAEASSGH
jgi:hypothetical protein